LTKVFLQPHHVELFAEFAADLSESAGLPETVLQMTAVI
jgi:hypothetical protein